MGSNGSFVKALLRAFAQFGQHVGQLQKWINGELVRRLRRRDGCIWKSPVRPLLSDRIAASVRMSENEGIDARHASRLEDLKALAAQWVERMGDRRPSQTGFVGVCS